MRGLTERTYDRITRKLREAGETAGGNAGGGAPVAVKFVRCDSATAVGASGVLAECYPATILAPAGDTAAPPEEEEGGCLLTLLTDDGESEAPNAGRVYVCLVSGSADGDTQSRPRAFGVAPSVGDIPNSRNTITAPEYSIVNAVTWEDADPHIPTLTLPGNGRYLIFGSIRMYASANVTLASYVGVFARARDKTSDLVLPGSIGGIWQHALTAPANPAQSGSWCFVALYSVGDGVPHTITWEGYKTSITGTWYDARIGAAVGLFGESNQAVLGYVKLDGVPGGTSGPPGPQGERGPAGVAGTDGAQLNAANNFTATQTFTAPNASSPAIVVKGAVAQVAPVIEVRDSANVLKLGIGIGSAAFTTDTGFNFSGGPADFASQKLTSVATPTVSGDAANKGYVDGAISGLSSVYQPLDAELTALAGLTSAADKLPYFTGSGTATLTDLTAAGRAILDDADAAAQRTTLGATTVGANLFTLTNPGAITFPKFNADNTVSAESASTYRTSLGLAIGTNVQAYDADLDALAALSGTNTIYYRSAANTWTAVTIGTNITFSGGTLSASGGSAATQAEQEAGSSTTVFTTPGRQHFHESACKGWVKFSVSGGVVTVNASYNVASVTRSSGGIFSVNWSNGFSSGNYAVIGNARGTSTNLLVIPGSSGTQNVGGVEVAVVSTAGTLTDPERCFVAGFGDL